MHVIEFPVVPCSTPIYNGFNHDAVVDIHGDLLQGPQNGFVVEFPSREGIAFHMSVRMGTIGGESAIVLNNMRNGGWQIEERYGNVFFLGQHFHMQIKSHSTHFSIHVNGNHLAHFYYREDPHHVTALTIRGDVRVQKIHFEHFIGMNGGGVQIGSTPTMVVAPAPAPVIVAPAPAPAVVIAPRPAPLVEVVLPPRRPIVEVIAPRPPPVVVVAPPRRPIIAPEKTAAVKP
ncbi:galactoside-binding lectin [Oesophagostomum dentatum]|uniref:Galectin n=1 Tax=Oesophagostomum dentatum TaxID=61180 RepID=A0A0B1T829_OESDE|nr:galactoside-binding lectin [Oesophagostomum dentatum]